MTASEFVSQMKGLKEDYRRNDAYVERFIPWNDDAWYDKSILAAYKMYKQITKANFPVLLLGDEGIRKMKELLFNFGLASATGIQDKELEALADQLQKKRDELKKRKGWLEPPRPDLKIPDLLGKEGHILSDQTWTTLLNDSLIGGAIHSGITCVLALSDKPTKGSSNLLSEQQMWSKMVADTRKYFQRDTRSYEEKWRAQWVSFFQKNIDMIYTSGRRSGPRVLARELLGLSFFGYTPVCTEFQLSFEKRTPTNIDFRVYMRKLNDLHFFADFNSDPLSKQLIISAILSFISGRAFNYREFV